MTPQPEGWIATQAKVTTCTYRTDPLRGLAFGIPTSKDYRITFDYYAHGRLYSDEFQSATAIPQNESFDLTYNPFDPAENSRTRRPTASSPGGGPPLWVIGVAGSLVLSLAWLAVLRGCR